MKLLTISMLLFFQSAFSCEVCMNHLMNIHDMLQVEIENTPKHFEENVYYLQGQQRGIEKSIIIIQKKCINYIYR